MWISPGSSDSLPWLRRERHFKLRFGGRNSSLSATPKTGTSIVSTWGCCGGDWGYGDRVRYCICTSMWNLSRRLGRVASSDAFPGRVQLITEYFGINKSWEKNLFTSRIINRKLNSLQAKSFKLISNHYLPETLYTNLKSLIYFKPTQYLLYKNTLWNWI